MYTRMDRLFYDTGKTHPHKNERELNLARMRREWPRNEWVYLTFDIGALIVSCC